MAYEPHPQTGPDTDAPPTPLPASESNLFSILAIVFGVIAILFLPIIFGIVGIVLGGIALKKQERLARIGMAVAVGGTIAGFVLSIIVYSSTS